MKQTIQLGARVFYQSRRTYLRTWHLLFESLCYLIEQLTTYGMD